VCVYEYDAARRGCSEATEVYVPSAAAVVSVYVEHARSIAAPMRRWATTAMLVEVAAAAFPRGRRWRLATGVGKELGLGTRTLEGPAATH